MSGTWTTSSIPDLTGKRALVTGVTGGIGEHTALELARAGAEVLLTARSLDKLDRVRRDILAEAPGVSLRCITLDLADLSSVRRAAAEASSAGPLHILVNNAGVMATPHVRTVDGFDLQLGTNHFGHFALTGLLLPRLVESGTARVVTVSSIAHRLVQHVPLSDPRLDDGRYSKWQAYGQSKLANLLFAFELDRRAQAAELPLTSVAAHPGYATTGLINTGMNMGRNRVDGVIAHAATRVLGQSAAAGAWPSLMAATADIPGGSYVGPGGLFEVRGAPRLVSCSRAARDPQQAAALWELSQQATGVAYP